MTQCTNCGAEAPEAKQRNGCLIAVLIVVGIFVLLAVLGFAVFSFQGNTVETSSGTAASTQTQPRPAANLQEDRP